ncbi:Pycsar system effector family protein [Streptomyces sp. NPDC059209]|uniref:Pycsar system effector family protein n=1 Tax=Streptomyces sp. NPDC059209 TaxID=3346769 RepID=UPI00369CC696
MGTTDQVADHRPAQYMFTALHATHQHADAKAGILAAVQAALAGTAGTWSPRAVLACEQGGVAAWVAGALLALFVCGLIGGVLSLAMALIPRIWQDSAVNRYSFVQLASGPDILPAEGASTSEAADRRELSRAIRFLARVAVRKYRWLARAVVCTAVMGVSAGLSVTLQQIMV